MAARLAAISAKSSDMDKRMLPNACAVQARNERLAWHYVVADLAGKFLRQFNVVVDDVFNMHAGEVGVSKESHRIRFAHVVFIFRNAAGMHAKQAQTSRHVWLRDSQRLANMTQLFT